MIKIIYNTTMRKEIKQSSLILAGGIILLFAFYSALPETKKSSKTATYGTKTVEEIIAGSYTKNYTQDTTEWDTTFNSAITPIKDKNGN